MARIDMDSLAQFEQDAKTGRADALYNLGLANSTGQGVGVDFIAAHKWFNLAASRGVEEAKRLRNQIAAEMNPGQITQAQKLAREWLAIFNANPPIAIEHQFTGNCGSISGRRRMLWGLV